MSKFIDHESSAMARTRSGHEHVGYHIRTTTHILDIPAELAALIHAVHDTDYDVTHIDAVGTAVSPLVLKLLIDHAARTGLSIGYKLANPHGVILFETEDVRKALPAYTSPMTKLESLPARLYAEGKIARGTYENPSENLRNAAIAGIMQNFPTRDGASGYGAAVRTTEGDIYFGGQYSTPDERLGAHAEMAVMTRALADGATGFTDIAIASSKFPDMPAPPCGACRQFMSEAAAATNSSITVHLHASQQEVAASYTLSELLPVQWSSKQ